jgi:hypothetical protein
LVFGQWHAHFGGDLRLLGAAPQFLLQAAHGVFYVLLALACAARHPVGLAQLVEHRAADALGGKSLELHPLPGLEA